MSAAIKPMITLQEICTEGGDNPPHQPNGRSSPQYARYCFVYYIGHVPQPSYQPTKKLVARSEPF